MDTPDLRPMQPIAPRGGRLVQLAVAAFILLTFAFAMWINISEWR